MTQVTHCRSFSLVSSALAGIALLTSAQSLHAGDGWTDLGGALAGAGGDAILSGTGSLQPFSPATLVLGNASPLSPAALFVSFETNAVPFKGGTLQTVPLALTLPLTTDGNGSIAFGFAAPVGLPTGFDFFVQMAIQDSGAVKGVALSNALQAIIPEAAPVVQSFLPVMGGPGAPITIEGAGFSDDPADVAVLVGGLLLTPITGTSTSFVGKLPAVPPADVGSEPIQVVVGEGRMIGLGANHGDGGGYQLPTIPGIVSTGTGMLWNNFNGEMSITTIDEFEKTDVSDDGGTGFFINEYLPNNVLTPTELRLPLGSIDWTATTTVQFNLFIVLDDGRKFAISLDEVKLDVTSQVACANALATVINELLEEAGVGSDLFALAVQVSPGVFEVRIFSFGSVGFSGVCGGWAVER